MNTIENISYEKGIFNISSHNFNELCLEQFFFQYKNNDLYRQYCDTIKINKHQVRSIRHIPFLPIRFFKSHDVKTTSFEPQLIFESSGTTGISSSRHLVKDPSLYTKSFTQTFRMFYGSPDQYCILGLLPSYLEKGHSSLVMMVDTLIKESGNKLSGFYLHDLTKLHSTLLHNELAGQQTLLIGVTYALLDFAERFPMKLRNTIVMETGGMKGRRVELTRAQVHRQIQQQMGVPIVHSEYGMTELLSQAYSKGDGFFHCPPWMRILFREEDDPFSIIPAEKIKENGITGIINVIDLANRYSCPFIATDDIGKIYPNGSFEVLGRMDNSEIRGCTLMVIPFLSGSSL